MRAAPVLRLLVAAWLFLLTVLYVQAWRGDPSPGSRARVLAHFTGAEIGAGRAYLAARLPVSAASEAAIPLLLLWLALGGAFRRLHGRIARFTGGGYWRTGAAFLLALYLALQALSLPFAAWSFAVERREGFALMIWGDWAWRLAKSWALGAPLFVAWNALAFAVVRRLPRAWIVALPALLTAFAAAVIVAAPVVITPLFHEQKPLPAGELRNRITSIAGRAGVPVDDIYVLDASRVSRHTNAYFTGLSGKRRIVLFDTLVLDHTPGETALIFAHEVGHWQHDHVTAGLALAFAGGLLGCLLLRAVHPWAAADPRLGLGPLDDVRNLPLLLAVVMIGSLLAAPVEAQVSQSFERQADRASLDLTGDPAAFIAAERRLAVSNRADLLPPPLRVFWLYSHPPSIDRIAMAEAWRDSHPPATTAVPPEGE